MSCPLEMSWMAPVLHAVAKSYVSYAFGVKAVPPNEPESFPRMVSQLAVDPVSSTLGKTRLYLYPAGARVCMCSNDLAFG